MMGGGRKKGLGKTTGYDYSVDVATERQDPKLTNKLDRFRIWGLNINPIYYYNLHCSYRGAAVLGRSHSYKICESMLSFLSGAPSKSRLQTHFHSMKIFYPTSHQQNGIVLQLFYPPNL